MKVFILLISLFFTSSIFAQSSFHQLQEQEILLDSLLKEVRTTRDDAHLSEVNELFRSELAKTLEIDSAFYYPFNSLTSLGKIYSQDKMIRVFSWNIQHIENFSFDYFSFILKKDERRKDKVDVIELKKGGDPLKMVQYETVGQDDWYGALYYDIIDVKRGRKTYYTLLAYDANDMRSAIKFIDVLHFTGKIPRFGAPIFKTDRGSPMRLLFEHSAKATMSMKYDKSRNMIIMDHLSPEVPQFAEFREYYVPDMSYDAYLWNGKQWEIQEDIVAINEERPKRLQLKAYDSKLDTVVNVPVKNQWEDPTDMNAPIDAGTHKAVLPEDNQDSKASKKRNNTKATGFPEEREYKGVSYTNLGNKKKRRKKK